MNRIVVERKATVDEFIEIRQSVGWRFPSRDAIHIGLTNTIFSVCVEEEDELIGYGRVVGDGGFTFYVQDIIVKPKYQNLGVGQSIMNRIMKYLYESYSDGTMICLLSAKGKEKFYKKFGFIERPNETFGAGMIKYLEKKN